jgi:hypothetical protein
MKTQQRVAARRSGRRVIVWSLMLLVCSTFIKGEDRVSTELFFVVCRNPSQTGNRNVCAVPPRRARNHEPSYGVNAYRAGRASGSKPKETQRKRDL